MAVNDFIQSARDPFFNPRQFVQNPQQPWAETPVIAGPGGFLEQNPQAIWARYLSGRGIGIGSPGARADWVRGQYNNMQTGFQAAQADDPTLTFQRYLGSLDFQNLLNNYMNLAPSQRGENWSRYAGPSRWLSDI